MNIVGITAEYNPFHQGHAWHLAQACRLTGADRAIVVMSGNYVQRGAPAMFDKYLRARAALLHGADLVLELPPDVATGSAEYFASGAVRLLLQTGIVTDLCFGSECNDLKALQKPAQILSEEPADYRAYLQEALRQGKAYPEARAQALQQYDPSLPPALLASPNDLLGIEYLKALHRHKSGIRVLTVPREGASYHDRRMDRQTAASASGIRQALIRSRGHFTPEILAQLPSPALYRPQEGRIPVTEDAFSLLLLERLLRAPGEPLEQYFGVTPELANRIRNHLDDFRSFSQFTDLIKTRNLTRTAVSRALLHILLNIKDCQPAGCFRVLGFRREAASLLKELAGRGSLPLVTSPQDEALPEHWLHADRLYESVRSLLHGTPFQNECRRKMLVI